MPNRSDTLYVDKVLVPTGNSERMASSKCRTHRSRRARLAAEAPVTVRHDQLERLPTTVCGTHCCRRHGG